LTASGFTDQHEIVRRVLLRSAVMGTLMLLSLPAQAHPRPAGKPAVAHATRPPAAQARSTALRGHARSSKAPRSLPPLTFEHLSTHEEFTLRPGPGGQIGKQQMMRLRHLLRCHHTGREHSITTRLVELLYSTARHFNENKIEIVAGYRAPRVARAKGTPKSHHREGRACDFRLEGVPLTVLRDYLRQRYRGVGVGYYPNSRFVHLDVDRKKNAYWIDYSRPGEPARYTPPEPEREPSPSQMDTAEEVPGPTEETQPVEAPTGPQEDTENAPTPAP
jgi:uncharacterized protein YcbK (DUF882 family)